MSNVPRFNQDAVCPYCGYADHLASDYNLKNGESKTVNCPHCGDFYVIKCTVITLYTTDEPGL